MYHREIYDKYLEVALLRANEPTKHAFENMAQLYYVWYGKCLPKNKDVKILDVGCGMGHFLYYLKKMGYTNFLGIDISPQAVDFVKKYITKNVILADAFEFLKGAKDFDVIVLNDIIEHIPKERVLELLKLCFNALKPGRKIFVKTDNMSNPFSLRLRYQDFTHEVGFTEESFVQVLYIAGFRNIRVFGASEPTWSMSISIRVLIKKIAHMILRLLFLIQGFSAPKILDKDIIAIAEKPNNPYCEFIPIMYNRFKS